MSSVDIVPVAESKQLEDSSVDSNSPEKAASQRPSGEAKESDVDTTNTSVRAPVKNPWSKIKSQPGQGKDWITFNWFQRIFY